VSAALAHEWEPHFRGGTPPQRLTMGPVQKNQTSSNLWCHCPHCSHPP
jgi:hypothetical protein